MFGFLSKLFYIIALRKNRNKNSKANSTDLMTNATVENPSAQIHRLVKRDLTHFSTNLTDNDTPSSSVDFLFKNSSTSTVFHGNYGYENNISNGEENLTENGSSSFSYVAKGTDSRLVENWLNDCLFNLNLILWIGFALVSTVYLFISFRSHGTKEKRWISRLKGTTAIAWIGVVLQGYRDFICSTGPNSTLQPVFNLLDFLQALSFLAIVYHIIMILLGWIQQKLSNSKSTSNLLLDYKPTQTC